MFLRALTLTVLSSVVAMAGASGTTSGFVGNFVADKRRFWFLSVVRKLPSRWRSVDILRLVLVLCPASSPEREERERERERID